MTHERRRLVVVGGSDAGIAAGMRAHELDPSSTPLVVAADAYPTSASVGCRSTCPTRPPTDATWATAAATTSKRPALQLRLNHAATHVNADNHTLDVRDLDGGTLVIGYEQLVIGTGTVPARPPIAGVDLDGVHVLHTMDHVLAVHADLTAASATRVLVVGAGYIGLELADASTHRSLDVTVVEMLDQVLPTVDAELADELRATPRSDGVTFATGVTFEAIEPGGTGLRACADDGTDRPAGIVVVAAGVRPDTALAETAGVTLGSTARSSSDRGMHSGVPDVGPRPAGRPGLGDDAALTLFARTYVTSSLRKCY